MKVISVAPVANTRLLTYRLGVLASAARAACVAELSKCVGPVVDVLTVTVSTVSAARRRRSSSIDGCAYDSWANIDDVPPTDVMDDVTATSWAVSTMTSLAVEGGNLSAVGTVSAPVDATVTLDVSKALSALVVGAATGITDKGRGTLSTLAVATATDMTEEGRWAVDNDDESVEATDDGGCFIPGNTRMELKITTHNTAHHIHQPLVFTSFRSRSFSVATPAV